MRLVRNFGTLAVLIGMVATACGDGEVPSTTAATTVQTPAGPVSLADLVCPLWESDCEVPAYDQAAGRSDPDVSYDGIAHEYLFQNAAAGSCVAYGFQSDAVYSLGLILERGDLLQATGIDLSDVATDATERLEGEVISVNDQSYRLWEFLNPDTDPLAYIAETMALLGVPDGVPEPGNLDDVRNILAPVYLLFPAMGEHMYAPSNRPVQSPFSLDGVAVNAYGGGTPVVVVDAGFGASDEIDPAQGHGMFVHGIAERLAPDSTITSVDLRIPGANAADTVGLLTAVTGIGPGSIVNMSFTGSTCYPEGPGYLDAIDHLNGSVVVAASGNAGFSSVGYPAAYAWIRPHVVSVSAAHYAGAGAPGPTAGWSNHPGSSTQSAAGAFVCAWGEDIVSDYPSATVQYVDGSSDTLGGFAIWSGTSFAAPRVSAYLASGGDDLLSEFTCS